MPELPEVETMRRGVLAVAGRKIARVERPRCKCRPMTIVPRFPTLAKAMTGHHVTAVERLGKRVVLRLDDDKRLIFEPRMTGLALLGDPPDRAHLRMVIHFAGAPQLKLSYWDRRGLGVLRLVNADAFAAMRSGGTIGPDAMDISLNEFHERLATGRRAIKVALLDQRAVAGIGNLYASEILHVARVHPARACRTLKPREWKAVHAAMREVLAAAIHHEGSTLSDGTYRNALNKEGSYQNHHRVYARAGKACLRCVRPAQVVRVVQAQRATFFCPRCQKE